MELNSKLRIIFGIIHVQLIEPDKFGSILQFRVHTTLSSQKVITFYDYFSYKNHVFFMTSAIF